MDIDIAGPIIDAIVKKQSVILKLDEQILENTSDEDIEVEITDADEYNLDLETHLRRYKKLAQTVTHNVLTSFTDEDDLMQFYRDSICLLQKGGFNLRSWNSNSNRLRELADTENILDSSNEVNMLGMRWNVADDKLLFAEVDIDSTMVDVTKREILRQSSKIFDPFGILSPVTVKDL
ncbi:unnamed protein product [Mytilus edulis]|uniref:Uncharacterized protein n=1 Tax=Mytilus edulis TaxID=6550 RepID=A0A8S3US43_MYTED|nr:unnamed protein product [Mytilus edulis]